MSTPTQERADTPVNADFPLPNGGLPEADRKKALAKLEAYFTQQKAKFLGYQTTENLDGKTNLGRFLNYHSNNVGDPFEESGYTLQSRPVERAVLKYYANLWHATSRTDDPATMPKDAYWGYVLTMGSSEGNVYALWNARDYLSGHSASLPGPRDAAAPTQHRSHPRDNTARDRPAASTMPRLWPTKNPRHC